MPATTIIAMTKAEWKAEGERRFGPDIRAWKFTCPACHHIASVGDWERAGAPEGSVAFACVGRWLDGCRDAFTTRERPGPCNYTGGGLIGLNPVHVEGDYGRVHELFAFAEAA